LRLQTRELGRSKVKQHRIDFEASDNCNQAVAGDVDIVYYTVHLK